MLVENANNNNKMTNGSQYDNAYGTCCTNLLKEESFLVKLGLTNKFAFTRDSKFIILCFDVDMSLSTPFRLKEDQILKFNLVS